MAFNHHDQKEQQDFSKNFTRIHADVDSSKDLVYRFAKEFFYDLMFDESKGNENAIVIYDAANDLIYEMKDFSKENPDITFTLETIDKYKNRVFKMMQIKNGEIEKDEKVESNYKKHSRNKNNGNKTNRHPQKLDTQPNQQVNVKEDKSVEQKQESDGVVKVKRRRAKVKENDVVLKEES